MPVCECGVIYTVDSDEEDIGLCKACADDTGGPDDEDGEADEQ